MPPDHSLLDHIAIVLVNPKYPENIGSAARAAWNMGVTRLIVVAEEYPEYRPMAKLATHHATHLLDSMEFHQDLGTALKPFSTVVGTTARRGRQRIPANSPREVMEHIVPLLPDNQVAFLFGAEDRGLTNEDLKFCQFRSAIPTADFSSLNLAQAVAIHCYEIFHAVVHKQRETVSKPKLATSYELEGMFQAVDSCLSEIDFLQDKSHDYYMRNIRQFLGRMELKSKETKLIQGVCRQLRSRQDK